RLVPGHHVEEMAWSRARELGVRVDRPAEAEHEGRNAASDQLALVADGSFARAALEVTVRERARTGSRRDGDAVPRRPLHGTTEPVVPQEGVVVVGMHRRLLPEVLRVDREAPSKLAAVAVSSSTVNARSVDEE